MARYVPSRGDIISLSFDPQAGYEQKGRRSALVLSHQLFNRHRGLAITCPITNTGRGIPFHVRMPPTVSVTGFVMVDQIKSADYMVRKAKFIERAPSSLVDDVLAMLDTCIR
jgi:mRNA interferase MazF